MTGWASPSTVLASTVFGGLGVLPWLFLKANFSDVDSECLTESAECSTLSQGKSILAVFAYSPELNLGYSLPCQEPRYDARRVWQIVQAKHDHLDKTQLEFEREREWYEGR